MPRGVESQEAQAKRFGREAEEWNRKAKESWRGCDSFGLMGLRRIISEKKAECLADIAKLGKSVAGMDADLEEIEGLIRAAQAREAIPGTKTITKGST